MIRTRNTQFLVTTSNFKMLKWKDYKNSAYLRKSISTLSLPSHTSCDSGIPLSTTELAKNGRKIISDWSGTYPDQVPGLGSQNSDFGFWKCHGEQGFSSFFPKFLAYLMIFLSGVQLHQSYCEILKSHQNAKNLAKKMKKNLVCTLS